MPSTEEIKRIHTRRSVPLAIQGIKVVFVYSCPACQRYTIHQPRLNRKGYWYIDHKRVPVHQIDFDGNKHFVGLAPEDSCFVDDNLAIHNIEKTRTVIRVN